MTALQVVSAPKDYTFQLRMNSEIKSELEKIFSECGLTLSDAFNVFIQQTLNKKGFPFSISPDKEETEKQLALLYLTMSYRNGLASSKTDEDWIDEEEMSKMLKEVRCA